MVLTEHDVSASAGAHGAGGSARRRSRRVECALGRVLGGMRRQAEKESSSSAAADDDNAAPGPPGAADGVHRVLRAL